MKIHMRVDRVYRDERRRLDGYGVWDIWVGSVHLHPENGSIDGQTRWNTFDQNWKALVKVVEKT